MADTLSERLGLEPVDDVTVRHSGNTEEALEADRRATVEAVVRWLVEEEWEYWAAQVRRELLAAPAPQEGEP